MYELFSPSPRFIKLMELINHHPHDYISFLEPLVKPENAKPC